jgi:hypothetical protein
MRLTRSRFNTTATPTTQLRKRLSNGIRKQTNTGVYLTDEAVVLHLGVGASQQQKLCDEGAMNGLRGVE